MKINAIRKSLPLLVSLSILLSNANVYAQSSASKTAPATNQKVTVSQEFLQKAEEALAKLDHLERQGAIKDERLAALEEIIKAQAELIKIQTDRGDAYKAAAAERATANQLDDARVKLFEESLKDFRAEVDRLRKERDSARRQQKMWGVVGLVLGVLAGVFAARR